MATNQITGGEALVRMLQLYGVNVIFGLCGDTSLPFYDALYQTRGDLTHVLTRDERHAGYMADAYARVTGRVGVCEGPSGGGATYIAPGVIEANESSIPLLAITSDISVTSRGRFTLTELDQERMFTPLTKFTKVIDKADELPRVLRHAFKEMTTGRPGAAHIGIPFDVQRQTISEAEIWAEPEYGRYPACRTGPDPDSIAIAVEIITNSDRPLFICGGGVVISSAEVELESLAKKIDAPIATTISGQGSIAEDNLLSLGVVGSNGGTLATRRVVDAADLIIFVGCRAGSVTTERWQHPVPDRAKIVHIDVDPGVMGSNYRTDATVVGDAKLCLDALCEAVPQREMANAQQLVAEARMEKHAEFRELAELTTKPIRPERIVDEFQKVLPDNTIIVADPGTPCPYFSAYYTFRDAGRNFISNRAHGALGYALPAVIGAYYGRSDAKCVAVMGDGSFGMAVGELETIKRLGLPVTMVVISNSVFGWIKAGQHVGYNERYFSVDFTRTDHAAVAKAYGIKTWSVKEPEELGSALKEAVELDQPALVDIISQPLHEARAPVSEWIA